MMDGVRVLSKGLNTVAQAAKLLGISRSKVYALMESGELAYVKIGKCRRVPTAALEELVDRSLVKRNA